MLERSNHVATRGPRVLARVVFPRESVTGNPSEPRAERNPGTPGARAESPSSQSIRSLAGPLCALTKYAPTLKGVGANDAIYIEHWTGRCLGALGTAAVAAAIGAARGLPVPYVSEADSTLVLSHALSLEGLEGVVAAPTLTDKPCPELRRVSRNGHVVVRAYSDGGPPTMIELAVPP